MSDDADFDDALHQFIHHGESGVWKSTGSGFADMKEGFRAGWKAAKAPVTDLRSLGLTDAERQEEAKEHGVKVPEAAPTHQPDELREAALHDKAFADGARAGWNAALSKNPLHDDYMRRMDKLSDDARAVLARLPDRETAQSVDCTLIDVLKEARETIDMLHQHGNFDNGVYDSTGSICEGTVMTDRYVKRALDKIDAALASPKRESGWQPIETAPKDGSPIWAILDYKDKGGLEQHAIHWTHHHSFPWKFLWGTERDRCAEHIPTHWMPLPEKPRRGLENNQGDV